MNNGQHWMLTNGTDASGLLGNWNMFTDGGSFLIQTDDENAKGDYSTVLRGCTVQSELLEIGLDVSILANQGP